jgi:hypothetical protein
MEKAPLHLLKNPKAETAGKSGVDYGHHQQALNFDYLQIDASGKIQDVRVGSLSIGLSYDGDWKTTSNGGRTRCLQSDKHLITSKPLSAATGRLHSLQPPETMRRTCCVDLTLVGTPMPSSY